MKKQRAIKKHHNSGTIILTIILVAVLGFATYWVAVNYETMKATFNGTKLYTQKEVTEAYNKGVEDKARYEKQVADWMTSYEAITTEKVALGEKIANNEKQIEQLTTEKEKLEEKQKQSEADYSIEIQNKIKQIKQLEDNLDELAIEYNTLVSGFEAYKVQNAENEQIVNAIAGLDYYIIAYEDDGVCKWFKVLRGETLGTSLPKAKDNSPLSNLPCTGWRSVNGGEVISNDSIATYIPQKHLILVKDIECEPAQPL